MAELVVRHEFMLDGKWYAIGQHVTDEAEIEAIKRDRPQYARAISSPPAAPSAVQE